MKIIITEEQYDFLKYSGEKVKLEYIEKFQEDLQNLIDDNLNSLLELNNKNLKEYNQITDLIVDDDIKVGIGNRIYDINVWAVVNKNNKNFFFINDNIIAWIIKEMIFDKFGLKVGLKLTMTLNNDNPPLL